MRLRMRRAKPGTSVQKAAREPRASTTDACRECLNSGGLLRHHAVKAKTGKPSAQRLKAGNGAASRRLHASAANAML